MSDNAANYHLVEDMHWGDPCWEIDEDNIDIDGMSIVIPTGDIPKHFKEFVVAHGPVKFRTRLSKNDFGTHIATDGHRRLFLPPMDVSSLHWP